MANPVPKNVAAVLGLVPTVLGGVRRLPAKAVQLPVIAIGSALSGLDVARREYGDLAERGEKLIARLRGSSLDQLEDAVESRLQDTPAAKLYEKAEDALEGVAKAAGRAAQNVNGGSTANAKSAVQAGKAKAKDRAEATAAVDAVQEALPVETPAPSSARVDSAASPDVIEQVEKIAANVDAPLITDHSDLPLADYDHMTLGALRGRLRSLDMHQLVQLRDYEKSKADRLPVITMLDNRIAKLSNGESVPSGAAAPEPSTAKPPKKVGTAAAAKADSNPPHSKVRYT